MVVAFVIACFLIPLLVEFLTKRYRVLNKIGAILLCYAIGLLFAQFLNHTKELAELQESLSGIAVFLAIPILLLSINTSNLRLVPKKMAIAAVLALVSLIIVVSVGHVLFSNTIPEPSNVSGMMIGVYTGGTPNLASIKTALGVSSEIYISIHTFDTFLGAIYILILLILSGVNKKERSNAKNDFKPETNFFRSFTWLQQSTWKVTVVEILVAIGITGISIGLSFLLKQKIDMTVVILTLTTLSVLAGIFASSKKMTTLEEPGNYFINVFSITVASMANFGNLLSIGTDLLAYVAFVLFVSFGLHVLFCRLFKIDRSIIMVTSVALICSPPFVPVITRPYKRSDLMLPGLMIGILGYVVGNYLGILFADILS